MQKAIEAFKEYPRRLFLVDAAGALLSAVLLGGVLVAFEDWFGIPVRVLYVLASFPVLFAGYDMVAFYRKNASVSRLLRGIALMNALYCVLSIVLAWTHRETIQPLGWAYLIGEIAILIVLITIEYRVANHHEASSQA